MTYDAAQQIARNHGFNLHMLSNGHLQLTDIKADPAGENTIAPTERGEWSRSDMRAALGY